MSHYAEYVKERAGHAVLEDARGFIVYVIGGEECYIVDAFTAPEYRRSGVASRMMSEIADIARGKGCTFLSCSVRANAKNATQSLTAILAYGFRLLSHDEKGIALVKEI